MKWRKLRDTIITIFLLGVSLGLPVYAAPVQPVYVIPVRETIDPGLASFVQRAFQEAAQKNASTIILEVDTPGGRIDAALAIRDTIRKSPVPTAALVKGGAISAGSLITLACPKIAMQPGATFGDAEPRLGSERADEKVVSYWTAEMKATAEVNGRDPRLAIAMADRDAGYPGLVEKGKLLTLTYQEAQKYGYADYIVRDRQELLQKLGLADAQVVEAGQSPSETMTRWVTGPYVAPLLLTLGIAGIIIEILTIGWGIAGTIGVLSLVLYFGGHLLAGFSGWEAIVLFILGLILMGVEAHVPGFGLPGLGGLGCLIAGIILASPDWQTGLASLLIAIGGTIVLVMISFRILTRRKLWDRLVLGLSFKKEDGYIPKSQDLSQYAGIKGEAYTVLRPAGSMLLPDGRRLDVVTNGEFIPQGTKILVEQVDGMRIVVRRDESHE